MLVANIITTSNTHSFLLPHRRFLSLKSPLYQTAFHHALFPLESTCWKRGKIHQIRERKDQNIQPLSCTHTSCSTPWDISYSGSLLLFCQVKLPKKRSLLSHPQWSKRDNLKSTAKALMTFVMHQLRT